MLAYSLTTNAIWRAMALGILCVIFLVVNLAAHPFENRMAQHLESVSLFLLCMLALTTAPGLAQAELKSTAPVQNEAPLEWLQLLIYVAPGVLCGVPYLRAKLRAARAYIGGDRDAARGSVQNVLPVVISIPSMYPGQSAWRVHVWALCLREREGAWCVVFLFWQPLANVCTLDCTILSLQRSTRSTRLAHCSRRHTRGTWET